MDKFEMEIYIANLAAYNAGFHYGQWVTLPCDEDELQSIINLTLDISSLPSYARARIHTPCEEIEIHDYDGPIKIEESDDIFSLNELATELQECDTRLIEAVFAYELDKDRALKILQSNPVWLENIESYEKLAMALTDDYTGYLPFDYNAVKNLINDSFIDWNQVGIELDVSGEWIIYEGIAWHYDNCL